MQQGLRGVSLWRKSAGLRVNVSRLCSTTTPGRRRTSRVRSSSPDDAIRESLPLIILSVGFFDRPAIERKLTLLHECIHIRFMLGSLRDRVIESHELEARHEILALERLFLTQRLDLAFKFRSLVDEILAELYLKITIQTTFGAGSSTTFVCATARSRLAFGSKSACSVLASGLRTRSTV